MSLELAIFSKFVAEIMFRPLSDVMQYICERRILNSTMVFKMISLIYAPV